MTDHLTSPFWLAVLLALLLVVSFLYSSVGHGGASGYLALLALFSIAPATMKTSALVLNVFVSLIAFYHYYKSGYFHWKLFLPFALASIPASFLGAMIPLDDSVYRKILGVCLLFPILRLVGMGGKDPVSAEPLKWGYGLLIGGLIGLLSGMIGIGGGILLSPVILLFHWAKMKETAAVSALFIFVNSISGLMGAFLKGTPFEPSLFLLLVVAILGGIAGSYYGARIFNNKVLSYILALVLAIASVKLMLT